MRLNCAWLLALAARLRLRLLRPHVFQQNARELQFVSLSLALKKPRCFSPNSPKTKSTCSEDDSMVFVARYSVSDLHMAIQRFICEFLPQHAPLPDNTTPPRICWDMSCLHFTWGDGKHNRCRSDQCQGCWRVSWGFSLLLWCLCDTCFLVLQSKQLRLLFV